jgi:bla regulator protein blaR1
MMRTAVGVGLLLSVCAGAQSFEVASIKRSPPPTIGEGQPPTGFQIPRGSGRLNTMRTTLRMLITFAYNVKDYQLSGGPGWANSETYDITAKAAENATPDQIRAMLQTLLRERFKLVLRQGTKEAPIYELVVAKGGVKIQEDTTSARSATMMTGRGKAGALRTSLANFVQLLGVVTGRPVVDKTGLTSTYKFDLNWTPDPGEGGPPALGGPDAAPLDSNGPSLFTALQEQLGLKLESAKGPVESLVIEGAEKPSEN